MKHFITGSKKYCVITSLTMIAMWWGLSSIYPPMIVPSPLETCAEFIKIKGTAEFYFDVFLTVKRLSVGILLAVVAGSAVGFLAALNESLENLLYPVTNMLQAVPPISWLALAHIWFGLNGQATIFIVFIATTPIMAISIAEGIKNIDVKLLDMGKIYGFSKLKIIWHIIVPALRSPFKSGFEIIIGLGWKLVIMGEVLGSNSGIGAEITDARLNIDTAKLFALTIDIVILHYVFNKVLQTIFKRNRIQSEGAAYDINT